MTLTHDDIAAPGLRHLCDLEATLGPMMVPGDVQAGQRRMVPITGGRVTGRLRGHVLNLGADWQTILPDRAELDTRYAIETEDGAVIDVRNFGIRHGPADVLDRVAAGEVVDPALYYMRTHPRLMTGDPRYEWLNRTILLGTGARLADRVLIRFYEVT
ncbi:DUF3237 domain-containing protein [Plastorhodobacter daqingensis]|uniref:UPF0311 protein ACFQXB_05825 n=1 Tax=Plastorhodobacter daqingensis TaxID=1387281 RepID=A0ABW2UHQ1_9RHOB